MEIISLNCMVGEFGDKYWGFLSKMAKTAEVFCLQEVETGKENRSARLEEVLPDFDCFYWKHERYGRGEMAIAVAARKTQRPQMLESRALLTMVVDPIKPAYSVAMVQRVGLASGLQVINFHGIYHPGDKLDSPLRLEQSWGLLEMVKRGGEEVVLLGDFNLAPETRSIGMLEGELVNLNTKFGVKDTRGKGCRYWGTVDYQPWADYGFVSKDIKVSGFEAMEEVVSDHKPLRLRLD